MCMLASVDIEGMLMPKFVIERDVPEPEIYPMLNCGKFPKVGQRSEGNGPRDSVAA